MAQTTVVVPRYHVRLRVMRYNLIVYNYHALYDKDDRGSAALSCLVTCHAL